MARGIKFPQPAANNKTLVIGPTNVNSPENFRDIMTYLDKHPDVDTIISLSTLTVKMAVNVSLNRTGSTDPDRVGGLWVGAFDATDEVVDNMKARIITAASSQTPYLQGAIPVLELFLQISTKQKLVQDTIWTGPLLLDKSNIESELILDRSSSLIDFIQQKKTAVVLNLNIPMENTRWNEALGGLVEAAALFGWDTRSATSIAELEQIQKDLLSNNPQPPAKDTVKPKYGPYQGIQSVVVSLADKNLYHDLLNATFLDPSIPIMGMGTVSNWTDISPRAAFLGPSDKEIGSIFASQILSSGFGVPLCLVEENGPWWQVTYCTQLYNFFSQIYGVAKVGQLSDMMLAVPANATDMEYNNQGGDGAGQLKDGTTPVADGSGSGQVLPTPENNLILQRFSANASLAFDSILCTSIPLYSVVDRLYPHLKKARAGSFNSAAIIPIAANLSLAANVQSLSKAAPDPSSPGVFVLGMSPKALYSLAHSQQVTGILNTQQYIQGFHAIISMTVRMMYSHRTNIFNKYYATGPVPVNHVCEPGQYYSSSRGSTSDGELIGGNAKSLSTSSPFSDPSSLTNYNTMLCVDSRGHVRFQSMCTRCQAGKYNNQTDATQCTDCPSGFGTQGVGQTQCLVCTGSICGPDSKGNATILLLLKMLELLKR